MFKVITHTQKEEGDETGLLSSVREFLIIFRGGFRIFMGGGGGAQKIMCPHYECGTELTFGRGPRAWKL